MAVHTIPTPPVGRFRWLLRREFEGRFYRLLFRWNRRAGFWYVDLGADNNVAKVRGLKMNLRADMLQPHQYLDIPPGILSVIDSSGAGREPTLSDFGTRVILQYTDSEPEDPNLPDPVTPPPAA